MEDHHRRELELDEQIKAGQRRQIQRLQQELAIERGENLVRVEGLQKAARAVEEELQAQLQAVRADLERYKRDVERVKDRARGRIAKREPPCHFGGRSDPHDETVKPAQSGCMRVTLAHR